MSVINLTQHTATADQAAAGVFNLPEAVRQELSTLLTFDDVSDATATEIAARAGRIALIAALHASPDDRDDDNGFADAAMIGGAPWLMRPLADALICQGIRPVFAFSKRETVEAPDGNGGVRKTAVFKHAGFVPA